MRPVKLPKNATLKDGKLTVPKKYHNVSQRIASKKKKKVKAVPKWSQLQEQ